MSVIARPRPDGLPGGQYLAGVAGRTSVVPGLWAADDTFSAVTLIAGKTRVTELVFADRPHIIQAIPIPGEWFGTDRGQGDWPNIGANGSITTAMTAIHNFARRETLAPRVSRMINVSLCSNLLFEPIAVAPVTRVGDQT